MARPASQPPGSMAGAVQRGPRRPGGGDAARARSLFQLASAEFEEDEHEDEDEDEVDAAASGPSVPRRRVPRPADPPATHPPAHGGPRGGAGAGAGPSGRGRGRRAPAAPPGLPPRAGAGGGESTCRAEDVLPRRSEPRTSEDVMHPNPNIRAPSPEEGPAWAAGEEPPSGPSAAEVAVAAEDMRRCMQEFGVDLATVTQAFLKNSGEVAAAECCLRTGQRPDSCPLWDRQDDLDLQAGGDLLRARLVTKYGAENVNRRVAFRNS